MTATDTGSAIDLAINKDRLSRAQAELDRQGVDYLLVGISSDLFYLFGYEGHASERLTMLVLPRSGAAAVVVPKLESPLLRSREALAGLRHPQQRAGRSGELSSPPPGLGVPRILWTA